MSYDNIPLPWQYGINHRNWRPFQFDAIQNIFDGFETKPIQILEAPTGTGKTAIATAVARIDDKFERTTVVVQNLGLLEQYKTYGFNILKGRQAYPCIDKERTEEWVKKYNRTPTAADCPFAEMYECKYGSKCPYMLAREKALNSQMMACTYKYAALSQKVQDRKGLFVMDEIHNAVSEILSIGSFIMFDDKRASVKLPSFPLKDYKNGDGGLITTDTLPEISEWILESTRRLGKVNLFDEITPEGAEKKKLFDQFMSLIELLSVCRGEVFYKCTKEDVWRTTGREKMYKAEFKTISPSYLYHKMVSNKSNILMMSATVGSPKALITGELRIKQDDYNYIKFPHPVPAEKRPIYDIADDAMSYSNLSKKPWLYDQQARRIAQWIKEKTKANWRGIVLTTSYKKIEHLRAGLSKYLGKHRIFENDSTSLNERIEEFMEDETPSMIHVDTIQGWGTGVDLRGDIARYCVVAGVPFINPSDAFEKIRSASHTGRAYATAFAYNAVMQAAGRVSRGEKNGNEYMLNVGAIADKMATSPYAKKHYSDWFKEAMVKD